jgi:hypothetical protein
VRSHHIWSCCCDGEGAVEGALLHISQHKSIEQSTSMPLMWGTIDYYITRLTSSTLNPPRRIDICNQNLTDNDAIRLADALLQTDGGSTLKKLRLHISSTGFLAICEAIGGVADSTSTLEELDVGNNRVVTNVDDFSFAIFLLFSAAPNLKHLDLTGNRIGLLSDEGMQLILDILSQYECSRLETLNLSANMLGDSAVIHLAEIMLSGFKSLTRLDLSLNYTGPSGAQALAQVVASNSPLERLLLRGNDVGDNGAALFASALKTNSTLLELNLGYNRMTSVGMDSLRMAVYDTTTLNALVTSNHTVSIFLNGYCTDDFHRWGRTKEQILEMEQILRINALPKQYHGLPPISQLKVAFCLSQNFDMKYFLHIDRKHLPEVLKFVGAKVGPEKLFYMMRNMPLAVCVS